MCKVYYQRKSCRHHKCPPEPQSSKPKHRVDNRNCIDVCRSSAQLGPSQTRAIAACLSRSLSQSRHWQSVCQHVQCWTTTNKDEERFVGQSERMINGDNGSKMILVLTTATSTITTPIIITIITIIIHWSRCCCSLHWLLIFPVGDFGNYLYAMDDRTNLQASISGH